MSDMHIKHSIISQQGHWRENHSEKLQRWGGGRNVGLIYNQLPLFPEPKTKEKDARDSQWWEHGGM